MQFHVTYKVLSIPCPEIVHHIRWCIRATARMWQPASVGNALYAIRLISTVHYLGRWFFTLSHYLQATAQTVFEVDLLRQLTMQLVFSACTFDSQASVYTAVHCDHDQVRLAAFSKRFHRSNASRADNVSDWKLNVTTLEDAWFLNQLIQTFADLGILNQQEFSQTTIGNRRNMELLCQRALLKMESGSPK